MQRPSIVAYFAPYFKDELVLVAARFDLHNKIPFRLTRTFHRWGTEVEGTSHNKFQEIYMLPFSGDTLSII